MDRRNHLADGGPFGDRSPEPSSHIAAYEAALVVASELNLGSVLQRLVDLARHVVPARYAALGVADEQGRIVQFITSGITPLERTAIGEIPQGHGLLGALIRERAPLLIADIAADPRSVGFPPHHPPMRSLLGVPVLLGERVLGNLYLTERADRETFSEADLAAVQILAAHAATAIDRAHLYREAQDSQRRAEEQRDHLTVILDSLPSAVLIQIPPDAMVEFANAAALATLLGTYASHATLPQPGYDYELLRADGTSLPREQWPGRRALRGEVVRNKQLTLSLPDGRTLPVLMQAAPLRDTDGEVVRAVVVFQDVTRLREAEQLKDDFLALVSHEVRTPLTAIQGGAHLLAQQAEDLDPQTQRELFADIVLESGKLDRTLANMLTLTAIQAGRLEPETEPVLLHSLVRKVMTMVAGRSPDHTFVMDLPTSLPLAEGDPALLGQVLSNLYENAVKYAPNGGEIRTTAVADETTVSLRVTDQGVGIAPEHLSHIFERFRRPGADPTVRGMGLGLYLSRHLVEAQGGTLEVTSPGPDKGATFAITLPLAAGWRGDDAPGGIPPRHA